MFSCQQHLALGGCVFCLGLLASTPFVWCFVFANLLSLEIFSPWQTHVYRLGFPAACLLSVLWTLVPAKRAVRAVKPAILLNISSAVLFFALRVYSTSVWVSAPCLFLVNLPLLCLWPRLAIEIVYLCPAIHQRFFELGLLSACTVFALSVVSRALEVSAVFMSPFFIFLALGSGSLAGARRNLIYTTGLERRRSIFCSRGEHAVASLKETLRRCPWDLLAISASTILVVCVMIVLHLHTGVFFGISRYLTLFLYGAMASGGLYLGHSIITVCAMATLCILTAVAVYFFHEALGPLGTSVLFISVFVYYFSAVAALSAAMRHKLKKFVNGPLVHLRVVYMCCFVFTLCEYLLVTFIKL
ncbi:BMRF2 [Macacine gammaherpesvirus 4]|uniref:BMRF2 n=1 Tax=Macacine gammaherpesvirus 4 TaxID=45455 RepID=Q8UZI3_9GAMA|nr:BMRF2 [Macacine gammaherpesvirus 4]AAK95426.1 BMRF2 [Macacine gammaherpesvirus 4]